VKGNDQIAIEKSGASWNAGEKCKKLAMSGRRMKNVKIARLFEGY
jgi:hypothetical protein